MQHFPMLAAMIVPCMFRIMVTVGLTIRLQVRGPRLAAAVDHFKPGLGDVAIVLAFTGLR